MRNQGDSDDLLSLVWSTTANAGKELDATRRGLPGKLAAGAPSTSLAVQIGGQPARPLYQAAAVAGLQLAS